MRSWRSIPRSPGALILALALTACGSDPAKAPQAPLLDVPDRPATAGDALLSLAPAGADAVLEIDFARLRANPVVGELVSSLARSPEAGAESAGLDLFAAADFLFVATYDLGEAPERLILLSGPRVDAVPGAVPAGDATVALASEKMAARLAAVRAGEAKPLSGDGELLGLRARAMPEAAPGASLRVTARLDADARLALARSLEIREVPVSVSVWGDVVDDLAVIALVGGAGDEDGARLARDLTRIRDRLAGSLAVRVLGLSRVLGGASIEAEGAAAKLILLIGPRRLARLTSIVERRLGAVAPKEKAE